MNPAGSMSLWHEAHDQWNDFLECRLNEAEHGVHLLPDHSHRGERNLFVERRSQMARILGKMPPALSLYVLPEQQDLAQVHGLMVGQEREHPAHALLIRSKVCLPGQIGLGHLGHSL